jgi:hypothetical protein
MGISPGVLPRTVTTIWRTELGTKLLNGFDSTTDKSAYFHYLRSFHAAMNRRIKGQFLSCMVPPAGHSASEEAAVDACLGDFVNTTPYLDN